MSAEISGQLENTGAELVVVDPSLEETLEKALQLQESSTRPKVMVNGPSTHGAPNLLDIIKDENHPKAEKVDVSILGVANFK